MKVIPITTQYTYNKHFVPLKPVFGSNSSDTFVKSSEPIFPLKEITLKTAEKLYNIDYEPVSAPREGYYLTYVLDKETGKPVDIYIRQVYSNFRDPKKPWLFKEKYCFYRLDDEGNLKFVGERRISRNPQDMKIASGYMETIDKSLVGLGLRGHQIAVERMLQEGYDVVDIEAIQDAYDFHCGAGFKSIDQYIYRDGPAKYKYISAWADKLSIPINVAEEMVVYNPNDISMINLNKTTENFILYLKKTGGKIWEDLSVVMRLQGAALEEWIKLSQMKPILIGRNIPLKVI